MNALTPNRPDAPAPVGLLAELTHRCPLRCPYCSNPLELDRRSGELDTQTWQRVLGEAAALGVLQLDHDLLAARLGRIGRGGGLAGRGELRLRGESFAVQRLRAREFALRQRHGAFRLERGEHRGRIGLHDE